jgi:hypothetical protein
MVEIGVLLFNHLHKFYKSVILQECQERSLMAKHNDKKMTASLVPEADVLEALREFVKETGLQAQAAGALGIGESYLNLILNGKRPIPPAIAERLGYQHLDLYEKSPTKEEV